jgi:hypothetical protein
MSQSQAKAALIKHGFDMPWACQGSWGNNDFINDWLAVCSSPAGSQNRFLRDKRNITLIFMVYRRNVRTSYDPDTGIPDRRVSTIPTDKLGEVSYRGPKAY